jgi:hypothetical protein
MSAIAAAFGRAHRARVVQGNRAARVRTHGYETAYRADGLYIPSSTADMWKGARPRPCR